MIWESHYWKADLLRVARRLENRRSQRRWPEASFAKVEQQIMLAAYSIRKLIEAKKVSDETRDHALTLRAFPATGKLVTHMNWHRLDELYELSKPTREQLPLRDLCNQIIHSFVFHSEVAEDGLVAFLVASDRQRHSSLFEVPIAAFIKILCSVGNDYPTEVRMLWNAKRQDYDVTSTTNRVEENS